MIKISEPIIEEEEIDAVTPILKSKFLVHDERVKEFEEKFSKYIGVGNAVAVNNGTAAPHIALLSLGIKLGDEVTSSFSFAASASVVLFCGARPVFADIDKQTFNIDPIEIKKKSSKNNSIS